jgi:hypothetical protein
MLASYVALQGISLGNVRKTNIDTFFRMYALVENAIELGNAHDVTNFVMGVVVVQSENVSPRDVKMVWHRIRHSVRVAYLVKLCRS